MNKKASFAVGIVVGLAAAFVGFYLWSSGVEDEAGEERKPKPDPRLVGSWYHDENLRAEVAPSGDKELDDLHEKIRLFGHKRLWMDLQDDWTYSDLNGITGTWELRGDLLVIHLITGAEVSKVLSVTQDTLTLGSIWYPDPAGRSARAWHRHIPKILD
jgi:hypothetical protein